MNPEWQARLSRLPFAGRIARSEGAAMFAVIGGFVNSQILLALVELKTLDALIDGPQSVAALARGARLPEDEVTYPDIDLHYSRRKGLRTLSHKDGTPYPGWPKETNR